MKSRDNLIIAIALPILIAVGIAYATSFTYTYDTDTPVGTDAPSVLDNRIREVKDAVQERLNVDHYFALTGSQVSDANTGEHRQITFHSPISDTPGVASGKGNLRIKDFNDVAELYWVDELENELRLTEQGELNLGSADIVGTLDNNTWFTAANKDNDGYVNLIKADADDNPIIPLNAELSSTTEPEEDAALICKKYVDDNLTANYSPATYEGGETTTLPNGLIFKMGYKATTSLTGTHTFNSAFPNGIVTVVMTDRGSEGKYEECIVTAQNISGFSWSTVAMTDKTGFNWIAIGY